MITHYNESEMESYGNSSVSWSMSGETIIKQEFESDHDDIKIEEHLLDYEIDNENNLRESILVTGKTIVKQQMELGLNLIKIEKQPGYFMTFTDKHTNG